MIFRTITIPAAHAALAVSIADALDYPERGMFREAVTAQGEEATETLAYISTGLIPADSPIIADAATLLAGLDARAPGHSFTLADCETFTAARDLVDTPPLTRIQELIAEMTGETEAADDWVQPVPGVEGKEPYSKNAHANHNGSLWVSMLDNNVWEPGVSGWRLAWNQSDPDLAPQWIQPTGAHDAYATGDEVTHPNAQDNGNVWLFRSKIDANTTEPGTDGAYHRWWTPVEAV